MIGCTTHFFKNIFRFFGILELASKIYLAKGKLCAFNGLAHQLHVFFFAQYGVIKPAKSYSRWLIFIF